MRIKKLKANDMWDIKKLKIEFTDTDNIIFVFEPYSDNPFSCYSDFLELIDFLLFNDSYTGAKNNMHINTLAECTMEKNGVEYTIGVKGNCSETKKDGKVRMRNVLDWYCVVPENELQGENGGWLGAQLSCDPQQYFYPKALKSWSQFDKNNEVNLSANLLETEEGMLNTYAKYNRRDFVNFEIENQKLIKEFCEIKINKDISIGLNEEDEYVLRFYGIEVTQQEDLGLVSFCGWINNLKIFEKLWIHAGEKGKLPVFIEKERGDSLSVYKNVLIEKLRETGRQVFIVSHERDEEMEKLCDKVIIVNK